MRVLVIGGGGREHALCWAFRQSPLLTALFAAPGNAGIAALATCLPIKADAVAELVEAALAQRIDFVMVGPEVALVAGVVDALEARGIAVFGPNAAAARLEGSKGFMKDLCSRAGIPTAAYARFTDHAAATAYVREQGAPIVIKADGLAAGKGVTVAMTVADALAALDAAMRDHAFGAAGSSVVIEEYMAGEEASFFALVDGETAIPFTHAQDHKRAFDADKGPNTGGMGAYSPARILSPDHSQQVMAEIILPTARAMVANGTPFRGVLFAGLMLTDKGIKLIEFNARFGDPETQAMLPRLKSDLLAVLYNISQGRIKEVVLAWHDSAALCVVMAAKGYPGAFATGSVIENLAAASAMPGTVIFHAATRRNPGGALTAQGGRVLGITGYGETLAAAKAHAYAAAAQVVWEGGFYRRDIGGRAE